MNEDAKLVEDHRLHPFPKVWRSDHEFSLKFRILTPFRLLMVKGFIVEPLAWLWRYVMIFFAIDCGLYYFHVYVVYRYLPFNHLPITRVAFGIAMAIPFALWHFERFQNYPLSKLLFGTNVKITIDNSEVTIRKGVSTEAYPRRYRLGFAQVPLNQARTSAYRSSDQLCVVVDDVRRDPIAEVFGRKILEHIVTNANVALLLATGQSDVEIDPMKERSWRLRGGR